MIKKLVLSGRDEWLVARSGRIGGSDAASVVGLNPYRTNVELWEIKTGQREQEDISEKDYVKYGTDAEQHLRALFQLDFPQYKVMYEENNLWLNDDLPFAHASLDGWLEDPFGRLGILEIKTTNILKSMQKEKWDNRIPDNYYIQLLHYMMVLPDMKFAELKAQLKYDFSGEIFLQTKHYHIEREDVQDDIDYLEHAERVFWEKIQKKERPALILPEI